MALSSFSPFIQNHYQILEYNHASAILTQDFPSEFTDLCDVLTAFRLKRSHISEPGGRKSKIANELDSFLYKRGWLEKQFDTRIQVDGVERITPTHSIDCYKNHVGIEIEWNNKDPFFDRDLNNFRLLFELKTISVGVIITRCTDLQEIFNRLGRGSSYGSSTTHVDKLWPRVLGGGACGCTVIVFGITQKLYVED
jgi:hypothetical protein